ncbi:hypothetical protein [Dactylosporangium sp. CA-092794]|uniref:hypothetical protein n=1 Tax=Dactylosporangium sp. CA-092794 TaxID=3239929 RepID=UPI003D8B51AD
MRGTSDQVRAAGGAVWRTCTTCQAPAPLPPDVERCDACRLGPAPTVPDGGEA